MTCRTRYAATVVVALILATAPAQAQDSDDSSGSRIQALIEEVRELMQRAEEKRQADPWLVEDVRQVLAKYDFPWQRTVYANSFDREADGAPEPWRVMSGEFRVDARGLRSLVPTTEQLAGGRENGQGEREGERKREQQSGDRNQQMRELLGSALDQALGTGSRDEPDEERRDERARSTPQPVPARAILPKAMANAFALRIKFRAEAPSAGSGGVAIGPYQGQQAEAGYRLVYRPGAGVDTAAFELIKRGSRGTESTVALSEGAPQVADGKQHTLLWTRDRDGRMQIDLDGKKIVDVTDRSFGDPFSGLVLHNGGGDYALSSLVIKDVR